MATRPSLFRWRLRTVMVAALALMASLSVGALSAGAATPSTTSVATVTPTTTSYGTGVTYTITVSSSGGIPQGVAFFEDGNDVLCGVASLTNGTGSCSSSAAPAGVDTISAVFPGNGSWGGSFGNTTLTVTVTPPPAPYGATGSSTASGTAQAGSFTVSQGNLFVQGNGPGGITVATYGANPEKVAPPGTITAYGDVAFGTGSAFSTVLVAECDEKAGDSLYFYNGTAWVAFSQQSNSADCIFGLIDASTAPTLAQMNGTPVAVSTLPPPQSPQGYWLVARDGGIFSFNRPFYGSTGSLSLAQPIVDMAPSHDLGGYWLVARDGGVFSFGDATYFGSLPAELQHVNNVVAIVPDADSGGYYLIESNGTVWAFHAPTLGDLPLFGVHVNNIVGGAMTPDARGMYLVGANGSVYNLVGDGVYAGDASGLHLNAPIIGMAVDPLTGGYWLLGQDGGVFSYNAPFFGSTGNIRLNQPVVAMTATGDGGGYWFTAADGGVFSFGDAQFYGSTGSIRLNQPVVSVAGG